MLFVANHSSHLDAPAVLAALPADLRTRTAVAAAEDYFYARPLTGLAVSHLVNAFPFPRRGTAGLVRSARLLNAGQSVLVFPEGSRSPDGRPRPFRPGAAALLRWTGVPVVPVGVVGTYHVLPRGSVVPEPGPITVRFGRPWRPPPEMAVDELTDALHARVVTLAQER
jgi:1-acyl-sn-glycerol-3-phosphate acyltransferase